MSRFTGFLIGFGLLIGIAWACSGHAQQPPPFIVQKNSIQQFTANALQHADGSPVYNFCDTPALCGSQPPPPLNCYSNLSVSWLGVASATVDSRVFDNLWGRSSPRLPPSGWPGANGPTLQWADTTSASLCARLVMPVNPGTTPHRLKTVSYGATQGLRARIAVVPAGTGWPTGADTPCYRTNLPFDDQQSLWIAPTSTNRTFCYVAPGSSVDILIDANDLNARGTMVWTWN